MGIKNLEDSYIYVKDFNEWIDIQKYIFSKDIFWIGDTYGKLFLKWSRGGEKYDLCFPRFLNIVKFGVDGLVIMNIDIKNNGGYLDNNIWYNILDEDNESYTVWDNIGLNRYLKSDNLFINKKEIRKLKLEKINERQGNM